MRVPIDRTHGGNHAKGVTDFSVSVNPFGPPREVVQLIRTHACEIANYPPVYSETLTRALARRHGLNPEEVIVGNGSTQLIYLLARVITPTKASVAIPTFSELTNALWQTGAEVEALILRQDEGFSLYESQVELALRNGAQALFIGRPNSPTGNLLDTESTRQIANLCRRYGAWLILDEAFIDFVDEKHSFIGFCSHFTQVLVLRSLTKIFTLPGLRIGYCVGAPQIIRRMREAQEPWSVNVLAELAALKCLEIENEFVARTRKLIEHERAFLVNALSRFEGLKVFPSCANFLMFKVEDEARRGNFAEHMLRHGIAVRDLRNLPGCEPGMYRIGVRRHADNERFISAVSTYFRQEHDYLQQDGR